MHGRAKRKAPINERLFFLEMLGYLLSSNYLSMQNNRHCQRIFLREVVANTYQVAYPFLSFQ